MTDFHHSTHNGTSPDPTDRLVASLGQWREDRTSTALRRGVADRRKIDASRTVIDQAKGALMLRYGIGSHQAFAVMVRWSQDTETDLPALAYTLVHGICQRDDDIKSRQPALVQWLEARLRDDIPDDAGPGQRQAGDDSTLRRRSI